MRTDRELLELAAKAAGITLTPNEDNDGGRYLTDNITVWNPLADDGDALRLAVKLGLCVAACNHRMEPFTRVSVTLKGTPEEEHRDDPYAATRRAIVRAAAIIAAAHQPSDKEPTL